MAIIGTHALFYSPEADAVRDVLRDVMKWPHVDAHGGWLIFRLPPAELGVHPTEGASHHSLSFMCDDLPATMQELSGKPGIQFKGEPADQGWGIVITMVLPGNLEVLLYQPRHPTAF
jgi:hypothetical protein